MASVENDTKTALPKKSKRRNKQQQKGHSNWTDSDINDSNLFRHFCQSKSLQKDLSKLWCKNDCICGTIHWNDKIDKIQMIVTMFYRLKKLKQSSARGENWGYIDVPNNKQLTDLLL